MKWWGALGLVLVLGACQAPEPWWKDAPGAVYEVLVYSFADSDGDGRGDLNGLTHRLDPLQTLGISALWLSPIHPAGSYHGYDVIDYRSIDPAQGTLADFDRLVQEAHQRGIHIVMDMVFNHTSIRHPWFQTKPTWYVTKKPGKSYGSATMGGWVSVPGGAYFATFWDQMPDLDLSNPEVVAEQKSILKFWLDRGVDGFRFDAAKEIFQSGKVDPAFPVVAKTKEYWNQMRDYARSVNPQVYFIGEVSTTSNLETKAYTGAFDGLFDFAQAKTLVDVPASGNAPRLAATWEQNYQMFSRTPGFVISPFLSNHDQDRVMSVALARFGAADQPGFAGQPGDPAEVLQAKTKALDRARAQALVLFTLPGLPYVYYGEELGLVGRRYKNDDIARRDAFPWGDADARGQTVTWTSTSGMVEPGQNQTTPPWTAQDRDPGSLLNWYRGAAALRAAHPSLRTGSFSRLESPDTVVSYLRQGAETLVVAVNFGEATAYRLPAGRWKGLVSSLPRASDEGEMTLEAGQAAVWVKLP